MIGPNSSQHPTLRSQMIGFIGTFLLLLIAFILVHHKLMSGWILTATILGLALLQAFFQVVFSMQLGAEQPPRWSLVMLFFTILVLIIVVVGSLWIMDNLDYNMMG